MWRSTFVFTLSVLIVICSIGKSQAVEKEFREFTPEAFTRLCPELIGGDKDFKGHGPRVEARATLSIRNNSTEVWVDLYLHAKETTKNWTEAEGRWEEKLWTAPAGMVIHKIKTDIESNTSYNDSNHELDKPAIRGGSLVKQFEIMGDTEGNDVGNCTDNDVYMNVYFNPVKVVLVPD